MSDTFFTCVRCAAVNPTCCRTDPANTSACFPLSDAEGERLLPYALEYGVPPWATEKNTPEFLRLLRVLFPDRRAALERAFPAGGEHKRLALGADGSCVFLQADGCSLPRHARPWYCQLFPIWIRGGSFDRFQPDACLLTHEAATLRDVLAAVGLTRETAKALYEALCHDWGMENYDRY